jgi:triosephosphate isomerase
VAAALAQGLVPLLCVGEPEQVRAAGRAEEHVGDQVRSALSGVAPTDLARVLVAYEPVWAIGEGGRPAEPADVVGVLDRVRAVVADLAPGVGLAGLLYGGSVSTANAAELLALEQVDGLFVGRAAWTAEGFAALLAIAGAAATERSRTSPAPGPSEG